MVCYDYNCYFIYLFIYLFIYFCFLFSGQPVPAKKAEGSDVGVVSNVAIYSLKAKVGKLESETEKLNKKLQQLEREKATLSLLNTEARFFFFFFCMLVSLFQTGMIVFSFHLLVLLLLLLWLLLWLLLLLPRHG